MWKLIKSQPKSKRVANINWELEGELKRDGSISSVHVEDMYGSITLNHIKTYN
jgi:hypothetical protein